MGPVARGAIAGFVLCCAAGGCGASAIARTDSTARAAGLRPAPARVSAAGPNRGPTTTYAGVGNRTIARIELTRDAVLHWTVSGGRFALRDRSGRLRVSGRGTRGQGFAARGDYRSVRVLARGRWRLQIQLLGAP